jgi:hypothetical protein
MVTGLEPMMYCARCRTYTYPDDEDADDFLASEFEPPDAPKPPRPS